MALGNTLKRVLVSIVAIPLVLALCYYGKLYFLFFILGIGGLAFYEFSNMSLNKNNKRSLLIGISSVVAVIINSYYHFTEFYILILIIILLLTITELFRNKESAINNLGSSLLGILYLGFFSSSIVRIREYFPGENYSSGGLLIISILVTIWICDSAAFFVGTAIGKHKLFPRVSPKKSWEGAIAGFLFSIVAMISAKFILLDILSLVDVIIIGLIIGVFGQVGDLIESLLKRDAGIKDSSQIIPGHGGIFDRFDSLIYTAPIIFIYLNFFY